MAPHRSVRIIVRVVAVLVGAVSVFVIDHAGIGLGVQRVDILRIELVHILKRTV